MKSPRYVKSGARCPQSGIWKVVGPVTTTLPLARGDLVPDYCGKKVKWQLLYPA